MSVKWSALLPLSFRRRLISFLQETANFQHYLAVLSGSTLISFLYILTANFGGFGKWLYKVVSRKGLLKMAKLSGKCIKKDISVLPLSPADMSVKIRKRYKSSTKLSGNYNLSTTLLTFLTYFNNLSFCLVLNVIIKRASSMFLQIKSYLVIPVI